MTPSAATAATGPTDGAPDAWETVVGLETHVQLQTRTKMFCACSADYSGAEPNTHTCPVCLGLPGALPVPNAAAVTLAARIGLALGGTIHTHTWFERKNYHYPDLAKGYQISQYEAPLCTGGGLDLDDAGTRTVRLERLHLEEDTGKLIHVQGGALIDFNRSGVPLVEIVTRPDLRSGDDARAYLEALRLLLRWLGVSSANMEDGALRVDVNVSVRPRAREALGTKVEVKNLNSFASVKATIDHEAARLIALLAEGGTVVHETRGWDEAAKRTVPQRAKESAEDYRYFPEPDIPPLVVDAAWLAAERAALPELPWARRRRLAQAGGLSAEAARLVTRDRNTADYVEMAFAALPGRAASLADWVVGPLFGLANAEGHDTAAMADRVPAGELAALVAMVDAGRLGRAAAKDVLALMYRDGDSALAVVAREGLGQVADDALERAVAEALAAEPRAVADFRAGKHSAIGFLLGAVMRATRGQADPAAARAALEAALRDGP